MRLIDKIERIPSTEGVVLYLPLDKAYMRGALVQDQSQEQNHGTAVNSPVPSQPGFLFTAASTQHIDCGEDASLDITTLSITAWVKLASGFSSIGNIASKGTVGSPGFSLKIDASKKVSINGANAAGVSGDEILPKEKWTFAGASYSGTTGKIYVNDSVAEVETITAPASEATINLLIAVANQVNEGAFVAYFDGHIADVRVYNRVLTDGDFLTHYIIQRGKYGV